MPGGVDFFGSGIICMILGLFMFGIVGISKIIFVIFVFLYVDLCDFGDFCVGNFGANNGIPPILGPTEPLKKCFKVDIIEDCKEDVKGRLMKALCVVEVSQCA